MDPGSCPGGTAEPEFTAPTANREGGGSKSGSRTAGNQNRVLPVATASDLGDVPDEAGVRAFWGSLVEAFTVY